MIQLHDVSLAFAGETILDELSWTVPPEGRIGLVGANGAGKTTLLRVMAGRLTPDDGRVDQGTARIGYLEQDISEQAGTTPREVALDAFSGVLALEEKEKRLTRALDEADDHTSEGYWDTLDKLGRVQEKLDTREAHRIRPRAEAMLTGLGFGPDELDEPLSSFSGGWRMRATLARLLLQEPDVLLLDEPTNHLDIDAIDWIEDVLADYDGTVVIVSHDRFFLDRMVTSIAELAHGGLASYEGNYSYYLDAREERRALQQARYENQQKKIKEIQAFIDKFRYNASKAAQVQSRVKKLEKMDRIKPPPEPPSGMRLRLPAPRRAGEVVMSLSRFSKTYPATDEGHAPTRVFSDAGPLHVERGDKIALIGPNGAGKSTLMRMLRGNEPFDGTREEGHKVDLAHFAQHQSEVLRPGHTLLESLREAAPPDRGDTELRSLLGAFLFTGEDAVRKNVSMLSGGEKSRLALARTLSSPANLLLLDEPTNHLDLPSREVLIDALQQYAGTFVVVSHDRHFIGEVADRIWRVEGGGVLDFPGSYEEYTWHREHGTAAGSSGDGAAPSSNAAPSANGEAASSRPAASENDSPRDGSTNGVAGDAGEGGGSPYADLNTYELRQTVEDAEAKIEELETKEADLQEQLADPTLYNDAKRTRETREEYERVQEELSDAYETWEKAGELLLEREDG